jgi:hypothetical protein
LADRRPAGAAAWRGDGAGVSAAVHRTAPRAAALALAIAGALALLGAAYLWAMRGAAIVLDLSWVGCI